MQCMQWWSASLLRLMPQAVRLAAASLWRIALQVTQRGAYTIWHHLGPEWQQMLQQFIAQVPLQTKACLHIESGCVMCGACLLVVHH